MERLEKGTILLLIVLVLLLATTIYVYVNKILTPTLNNNEIIAMYEKNKKEEQKDLEPVEEDVKELTEEEKILELKSMSETNRIHQYFSEYINSVDERDYELAYGYLYPEFKQNYFPDQASFETYVDENYPKYLGIEYEDIERQGSYYILTVRIYNALDEEVTEYVKQKFIVYELEFGEFVLSFQV